LTLNSEPTRFKSKRNTVLLCDGVIEKHYSSVEMAAFEARELRRLKTLGFLRVPEVVELSGAVLKMQYIPGDTLPDIIAHSENSSASISAETIVDSLVGWLREFYRAVDTDITGEIRGDVNGRNFIFDGTYCWSVDFEEKIYGVKEQDIGRLMAFILTYDPAGTSVKKELAEMLLKLAVREIQVEVEEIFRWRDLELQAMMRRRTKIPLAHLNNL